MAKNNVKLTKPLDSFRELKPLNSLFLTLAVIINACGVVLFLFPVKLYDSGISGLSMLLDQVTPPFLVLSLFLLVLNLSRHKEDLGKRYKD